MKMKRSLLLGAALAPLVLSGCSLFVPFDSEFMCPGTTDYGKCTDVQGAYSDALGGELPADEAIAKDRKRDKNDRPPEPRSRSVARANVNRYKAAEYAELAKVIEDPVTPLVQPPKILRTLIVAYATGEKTLYMPRYVFYFANDGTFVYGDYLNAEKPMGGQTIYPNGVRP